MCVSVSVDATLTNGIDNESARMSSIALFVASGGLTAALASYSF